MGWERGRSEMDAEFKREKVCVQVLEIDWVELAGSGGDLLAVSIIVNLLFPLLL